MRRERLKDQIEHPRVSVFDSFVRALVVLVSLGAVYYALSGRGYPLRPRLESAAPVPASEPLTLLVTKDHSFYWGKSGPFALGEFGPRLATWRQTAPRPEIVITADKSALLADALHLFNEARRQGVSNVHLEAHPRPAS
jgi:biopolymer transport protein ExbD